ncbi:MAG: gliding motility-associated C-terminal domain-containing protein [Flavobacteriales bacterium]
MYKRQLSLSLGGLTPVLKAFFNLIVLFAPVIAWAQMRFVPNAGQWPDHVNARAELTHGQIWYEQNAITYQLFDPAFIQGLHPGNAHPDSIVGHVYRMRFVGADLQGTSGLDPEKYYYNFYQNNDPLHWADHVPVFNQWLFHHIYPHIDTRFYSTSETAKYDFIVAPGGDPTQITLQFEGVDAALIDGEIHLKTAVGEVIEKKPFAYQIIGAQLVEIPIAYVLENNQLRFAIGTYNKAVDLVIDPEIAFSTYIGSPASNFGFTAANDSDDALISGAAVFAAGYPTTTGAFSQNFNTSANNYMDVALSKFSADGSQLLYSTYLGGNVQETPHSIVADSQNNFILMGVTGSNNFPTTTGAFQTTFMGGPLLVMNNFFTSGHLNGCDFFLSKFDPNGVMLQSTFVGGDANDGLNYADQLYFNYGDAFRGEVNVDQGDNIYVASVSRGNFPMINQGAQQTYGGGDCDGIVFKMNSSLSALMACTYLGGNGADAAYAIEFDQFGNLIIAGGTKSANYPHASNGHDISHNGQTDGFITRLNSTTFEVLSGTFVGTMEYDQVYFVQTDENGDIYALGQSEGDMGISPGLYGQPNSGQFIRKYNASLGALTWTTTIGTSSGHIDISPTAFLVSECNQIYFSGWGGETNSNVCQTAYDCYAVNSTTNGLPITADAFQSTTDGSDFYLCVLNADATDLLYASFLGGAESSEHVDGGTSRFAKNGTVYQAVCAGCQNNSDFPTSPGAWSATNESMGCNLAVFRFNLGKIVAEINIDGPSTVCEGSPAAFINTSQGANQYNWTFGDGGTSNQEDPIHTFEQSGEFQIMMIASHTNDCLDPDTTYITITVLPGVNPQIEEIGPVCSGDQIQLQATGTANLIWVNDPLLSSTTIPNPTAIVDATHTFYAVDSNNCETDTVGVVVEVFPSVSDISNDATICLGGTTTLQAFGGVSYLWSPAQWLNSATSPTPVASPIDTTVFTVEITNNNGCVEVQEVTVNVISDFPGGNIYPDETICLGNNVQITANDASIWQWTPTAGISNPSAQSVMASPTTTTTYTIALINPCGSGEDQVTVHVIVPEITASGGGTICFGSWLEVSATGGVSYIWSPAEYCSDPAAQTTFVSPPTTTTMTVTGIDENGCAAEATVEVNILEAPNVDAGPDIYFDAPGVVQLMGNNFGLDYYWNDSEDLSCTDCIYPYAWPDEPTYFYLTVTDGLGCTATDSVFVKPYFPVYIPNTITPNNDGINDVFRVYGENLENFNLKIFNRWGELIFETTDPEQVWVPGIDGYYVQDGVYIWTVSYESLERKTERIGHVNVLR